MKTISFEEAREKYPIKMDSDTEWSVRDDKNDDKIISEIELMWQTAVVNLQKDGEDTGDGKIALLNRFFEFDAEGFQPIFKSVSVDYDACREYLQKTIFSDGKYLPEFIGRLCGKCGNLRSAFLNVTKPDGEIVSTSWAVQGDHLSTVVMTAQWDLWRDAIREIVTIFLTHIILSHSIGVKPGPISFVCNQITLHKEDIPTVNDAVSAFREAVRVKTYMETRLQMWKFINQGPIEKEPDETDIEFADRQAAIEKKKEGNIRELAELEEKLPINRDCFEVCIQQPKISFKTESCADVPVEDILNLMELPKIRTIDYAPTAPIV